LAPNISLEEFDSTYMDRLRLTSGVEVARLAVVSNFFLPDWPRRVLKEFGISSRFDFVVDSCSVGYKKPGTEIFEAAVKKAGLPSTSLRSICLLGIAGVTTWWRLGDLVCAHFTSISRSAAHGQMRGWILVRIWLVGVQSMSAVAPNETDAADLRKRHFSCWRKKSASSIGR
jgi:hypothetical protein